MELTEIKKSLYKEKPNAIKLAEINNASLYKTVLNNGKTICFSIPHEEMGETKFGELEPAQLLIRWIWKDFEFNGYDEII